MSKPAAHVGGECSCRGRTRRPRRRPHRCCERGHRRRGLRADDPPWVLTQQLGPNASTTPSMASSVNRCSPVTISNSTTHSDLTSSAAPAARHLGCVEALASVAAGRRRREDGYENAVPWYRACRRRAARRRSVPSAGSKSCAPGIRLAEEQGERRSSEDTGPFPVTSGYLLPGKSQTSRQAHDGGDVGLRTVPSRYNQAGDGVHWSADPRALLAVRDAPTVALAARRVWR